MFNKEKQANKQHFDSHLTSANVIQQNQISTIKDDYSNCLHPSDTLDRGILSSGMVHTRSLQQDFSFPADSGMI